MDQALYHSDVSLFHMSACVRWFSMDLQSVIHVKKLKLFAANPVLFERNMSGLISNR